MSESQYYDPISQELLVEPILVPCCGQALSRHIVANWFITQQRKGVNPSCPLCNNVKNIKSFDPMTAAKVVYIADRVEEYMKENNLEAPDVEYVATPREGGKEKEEKEEEEKEVLEEEGEGEEGDEENEHSEKKLSSSAPQWSAQYTPVMVGKDAIPLSNLNLSLQKSNFVAKRVLCIVVADRSGSMSWSTHDAANMTPETPWKQVETALLQIDLLRREYGCVELEVVGYDSNAERINVVGDRESVETTIRHMYTGGGTQFGAAFECIEKILTDYYHDDDSAKVNDTFNVDSIDIIFMTDGQAGDKTPKSLPSMFRQILARAWDRRIVVHTVGFSSACDKELLEELRKSGSEEGTFRYTEPSDGQDELTNKVTNLFELTSSAFTVDLSLSLEHGTFVDNSGNSTSTRTVRFPVKPDGTGSLDVWIRCEEDTSKMPSLILQPNDLTVPVSLDPRAERTGQYYYSKWLSHQVDLLARQVFELNTKHSQNPKRDPGTSLQNPKRDPGTSSAVVQFHADILAQKAKLLLSCATEEYIMDRIEFIVKQIDLIRGGASVDIGRLGDMRYASQFKATSKKKTTPSTSSQSTIANSNAKYLPQTPTWMEMQVFIRWGDCNNRNKFQVFVITSQDNYMDKEKHRWLNQLSESDVTYQDDDGNNALHLMAYAGQNKLLEEVIKKFQSLNLDCENNNGDTPLILAAKRYGHHKCVQVLLDHGATISEERKNGLEQFVRSQGFSITRALIANAGNLSTKINMGTEVEQIDIIYERAMKSNAEIDVLNYLEVCLSKCHVKMVQTLIQKHQVEPTFEQLMKYCFPPKVDDPDADKYVEMTKLILNASPNFIHQTDENHESALHRAVISGNLPCVVFFAEAGSDLEARNNLGNTPLWLACAKRYPCIIEDLLQRGADPNAKNEKGDTSMYPICQYGPLKVVDTLLSFDADVRNINRNGDTLILISCRNGQDEILKTMLSYVSMDFINRKAQIDGFNAIMASAESGHGKCIRVLHAHGINIEQRTDTDNEILKGATPLQIAIYYSNVDAVYTLLDLGADPNTKDVFGMTALHHAVMKGNIPIIQLVAKYGGDFAIEDNQGNRPLFYCRNDSIKRALLPRSLESLMKLARGDYSSKEEEEEILTILKESDLNVDGCFTSAEIVNVRDSDGNTPLLVSVIHSRHKVFETLFMLGSDFMEINDYNLSPYVWAKWTRNAAMLDVLFNELDNDKRLDRDKSTLLRLEQASNETPLSRTILFLGRPPMELKLPEVSGIIDRMHALSKCVSVKRADGPMQLIAGKNSSVNLAQMSGIIADPSFLFYTKVHVINTIGRYPKLSLNPENLAILSLYLNHADLFIKTNRAILDYAVNKTPLQPNIQQCLSALNLALEKCEIYQGEELYIGLDSIDRTYLQQGAEVTFPTLISASTSWQVAMEASPRFEDKKMGVILMLRSTSAKYVASYSPFGVDAEVLITPPTKFVVKRWYRGDPICLGQANIREHTFGLKDQDLDSYVTSDRALIIEMEEMNEEIEKTEETKKMNGEIEETKKVKK